MTGRNLGKVIRYLHGAAGPGACGGPTDGQLLDRYVTQRDEAAFELLLWRHGGMVLNVCRRVLHDEQDAEDAFQATFLAFIRKARSIIRREAVAGWLYRVAYRVALEAKAKAQKTARHEKRGGDLLAVAAASEPGWGELRLLLDEEMNRLPERFRLPLVLCYLEGKTNAEAARQLGCPPGTIFSRLARGRELLRHRLSRRGLVLSSGALIASLSHHAASAAPAPVLVSSTFQSALLFAVARTAAGGARARVITLAEGVLKAMYLTKLKVTAGVLLVMGALVAGGVWTRHALEAAPPQGPDKEQVALPGDAPKAAPEAKKTPPMVQVRTPLQGGLERKTVALGMIRPSDQEEIFAPVSGVLKNFSVDLGSRVKRGELLAEIHAPLLVLEEKQAAVAVKQAKGLVLEAEARHATARAEVEVAKTFVREKEAAVDSAKATLTYRQGQADRVKALQAAKTLAREVDEQMSKLESARAQVSAADAALANAKADVQVKQSKVAQAEAALTSAWANLENAELALEKAQYSLSLTRIVAPFDGVVSQRNYRAGHTVRSGEQGGRLSLLTVVRTDSVRVVVDVPDSEVPLTESGLPVDLDIFSVPETRLTGFKVSRIGFVQDETTRTMRVEIDVPNPKELLRPGMRGRATIHLRKGASDALRVPASAVLRHQGAPVVYVVRDGKARRTPIEMGRQDGKEVEVCSGLKPADRVVIDAKVLTGDAVPVEVKNDSASK